MIFAGYALLTIATVFAWVLSWRVAEHRPVALLLSLHLLTNLARRALTVCVIAPAALRFGLAPFEGWARVAGHVDDALFLAWRAGLAAAVVAVFLPRRSRPLFAVGVTWALAVIAIAVMYPTTRGPVLARSYLAAELAAVAVSVGVIAMWIRTRRSPDLQHVSVALVVATEIVIVLAGPWRFGLFASWSGALSAYVALFAMLTALQGGSLWLTRGFFTSP